ncbi:MAG: FtsX-like permease family protein [Bacteroidota bacterium]
MMIFKLAMKNLLGAGLRTWLIVAVLSFAFVIIIFYNGMIDGWNEQARNDTIAWEIGQGQLWHQAYDPYDPFTLQDAHGNIPTDVHPEQLVPELITQATIYPSGRMLPINMKGIPANQKILALPTDKLVSENGDIPILIGKRMAKSTKLQVGDQVLVRWRDTNGTFDALQVRVAAIFEADVPTIDKGQVWLDLAQLQEMTGMPNEATLLVTGEGYQHQETEGWAHKDHAFLLAELDAIIQSKKGSGSIMYVLLLGIALLAIFDTQVLSVFRRQKEIGTLIALGMTRSQVVSLFTIEGGANSLLAAIVGAIYGIPLFVWLTKVGIPMPSANQDIGIAIAEKIFPTYGLGLVVGTTLLVVIASTVVSYMPSRKIAHMNPVEALKGKIS